MQKIIFTIFIIFSLVGCGHTKDNVTIQENANKMYANLTEHIRSYTDSLHHSIDSISIEKTINEYESILTEIIFSYPPNTDMVMTTAQHDTLWQLTDQFIKLKKAKQASLNKSYADTTKITKT